MGKRGLSSESFYASISWVALYMYIYVYTICKYKYLVYAIYTIYKIKCWKKNKPKEMFKNRWVTSSYYMWNDGTFSMYFMDKYYCILYELL